MFYTQRYHISPKPGQLVSHTLLIEWLRLGVQTRSRCHPAGGVADLYGSSTDLVPISSIGDPQPDVAHKCNCRIARHVHPEKSHQREKVADMEGRCGGINADICAYGLFCEQPVKGLSTTTRVSVRCCRRERTSYPAISFTSPRSSKTVTMLFLLPDLICLACSFQYFSWFGSGAAQKPRRGQCGPLSCVQPQWPYREGRDRGRCLRSPIAAVDLAMGLGRLSQNIRRCGLSQRQAFRTLVGFSRTLSPCKAIS